MGRTTRRNRRIRKSDVFPIVVCSILAVPVALGSAFVLYAVTYCAAV